MAMEQYRDGTFGEPAPVEDKLRDLLSQLEDKSSALDSALKAVHVGSPEELEAVREKLPLEERVDRLERKVDALLIELGKGDRSQVVIAEKLPA